MNVLNSGTRSRLILVLAAVFLSTLAVYTLAYALYEPLATGIVVAWAATIITMIIYLERKRAGVLGLENQYQELRSYINLQPMISDAFLPYSFWAMEPSSMLNLLSTIQYGGHRTIVECGSGVSTILIGKLLKQLGAGHLYSLEEDENWFKVMSGAIAHDELAEYVTLYFAPLEQNPESGELWYGLDSVGQIRERAAHIDLLLIDGPKSIGPLSRYPALPAFAPVLDAESLIVLDDSKRPFEQAVIKRWSQSFDIQTEKLSSSLRGQTYIRLRSAK